MRFRRKCDVDYDSVVTVPICDGSDKIVCCVDVYGVTIYDLIQPGGARPLFKAIERLGLDPYRYHASLWNARQVPPYGDLDEREGEEYGTAGNL
jgi:hypothetical protein